MNIKPFLEQIVTDEAMHTRWLNTLSMMENTGARKISAAEDRIKVDMLMLKHAAEEARHAYFLKKQIQKISPGTCPDYSPEFLLAPYESLAYLHLLDVRVCHYLRHTLGLKGKDLKYAAYLLVTYAIEVRADELYPVYQEVLDSISSKVNVKTIIAEEEGHLEEMTRQLEAFSKVWQKHASHALEIEKELFENWLNRLNELIELTER